MLTDTKLSKAQLSKIIQSGGFLPNMLDNIGKNVITDLAIPLASHNLHGLVSNLALNTVNKFDRKASRKGVVRTEKEFILFNSNEDMNDIIKIIKSLEDSNVLIDGITETVKYEIKKHGTRYHPAL